MEIWLRRKTKLSLHNQTLRKKMTSGTLICIPKNCTIDEPRVVFDNKYDRYTLIVLTSNKGIRIILGADFKATTNEQYCFFSNRTL